MKATEIRELTGEELNQRLLETRQEYFNLRIQQSTNRLERASRLRDLRRDLARIKTVMNERRKVAG